MGQKEKFSYRRIQLTARFPIRRAVFFIGSALLFFAGCTRQLHKPAVVPPAPRIPAIRVALEDNLRDGKLLFNGTFRLESEEATYLLDESTGEFTIHRDADRLILQSIRRQFFRNLNKPIRIINSGDGTFTWNGIPYSGNISFVLSSGAVFVVNTLPIETYLEGVVPHEIPSRNPEYYHALQAQAVAARSYAFYHMEHPASADFDVFADTRDQVYRGKQTSGEAAGRAVKETAGLVLVDSLGKMLEARYHSTCGGYLETGNGTRADKRDSSQNCSASPLFRWVKRSTSDRILDNLEKMGEINEQQKKQLQETGYHMSLQVNRRLASGRIKELTIGVDDQSFNFSDWEIRRALSDQWGSPLPSTLFFLMASQQDSAGFYVIGAGFGHGDGLCQWGAIGMSAKDIPFRKILAFYYPSAKIKKWY